LPNYPEITRSNLRRAIILGLITMVFSCRANKKEISNSTPLNSFPLFQSVDFNGQTIDSRDFTGYLTYVQFIISYNPNDMEMIKQVIDNWGEKLNIIVFTENAKVFIDKSKIIVNTERLHIIEKDYKRLAELFRSHKTNNLYYLFGKSGNLITYGSGQNGYREGVKTYLMEYLNKDYFIINEFLPKKTKIEDIPWLKDLESRVSQCCYFNLL